MGDNTHPDDDLMVAEPPIEENVRPDDRIDDERLDEENTLKADYVRNVRGLLDAGDKGGVYDLVEPLHPADIADLFELCDENERRDLAHSSVNGGSRTAGLLHRFV